MDCVRAPSSSSSPRARPPPRPARGGFAWAGAPAIVASLWEVDESTAELMATFYRALEANTSDRLEALRNAKLNLIRGKQGKATPYAAPWQASFQLYGDFRAPAAP